MNFMKPLSLEDPTVKKFFENTYVAWTSGEITGNYSKEAKKKGVKGLYKLYSPKKQPILYFFQSCQPRLHEFLLGLSMIGKKKSAQ